MRRTCPEKTRFAVAARCGYRCERCGMKVTHGLEMSHRQARGMGGSTRGQDDPALYNGLCHHCHAWVEANPFAARRWGWKVPRGRALDEWPCKTWQGWKRLTRDGGYADDPNADAGDPEWSPA